MEQGPQWPTQSHREFGALPEYRPPRKRHPWILPVVGGGLLTFIAFMAGAATNASTQHPTTSSAQAQVRTVSEVPQSCRDALDAAVGIRASYKRYVHNSQAWPVIVQDVIAVALNPYDTTGADAVTAKIKRLNRQIQDETTNLAPLVDAYDTASADCRG